MWQSAPPREQARCRAPPRARIARRQDGRIKALMLAHGLSIDMMVVINSGLATAQTVLLVGHEAMAERPRTPPVRGRHAASPFGPF